MSDAWIEKLARPSTRLRFTLFGHHSVPRDWRVEHAGLREHLVWLISSGEAEGSVGKASVRLRAGSLLWLPPQTPFAFALTQPAKPIALYRFRFVAHLSKMHPIVLDGAGGMLPTMVAIHTELTTRRPHRGARLRALLVALAVDAVRMRRPAARQRSILSPAQVERLHAYVGGAPAQRVEPAELAALLRLSPDYFTRLFRRTFGEPPRTWLVRQRIQEAAFRLADPGRTVGEVAHELGYPDVFLFSRQFKRVLGVSPRAYRSRD